MARRNGDKIDGLLFNVGAWIRAGVWLHRDHADEGTQGIAGREEQYCRWNGTAIEQWHLRWLLDEGSSHYLISALMAT